MLGTLKKYYPWITKVVDAKRAVTIEVTKKDSATGKRRSHETCAMAVACEKMFKADGVVISRSNAYIIKKDKAIKFAIPQSVSREIVSFDRGAGFEPGIYQLSKPKKSYPKSSGEHTGNGKRKSHRHITDNVRVNVHSDIE